MASEERVYVLGHDDAELKRLDLQGQFWGEATLEWLSRAGIRSGMRVLDIGCGTGDVSCLAARLVGRGGSVVGVDRSPEAVQAAQRRAEAAGLPAEFRVLDLAAWRPEDSFDALVGRFVLMYFPDPAAVLRRLAGAVRPGGTIAFLEMSMDRAGSVPPVDGVQAVVRLLQHTFRRAGVDTDFGPRLWQIYRSAGLPEPALMVRGRIEAPPAAASATLLAETVRSLLPMMQRFEVAGADLASAPDLPRRIQEALDAGQSALVTPVLFGAWTRQVPAESTG